MERERASDAYYFSCIYTDNLATSNASHNQEKLLKVDDEITKVTASIILESYERTKSFHMDI